MAAALTILAKVNHNNAIEVVGSVALSGSYATGGDSLPIANFDAKTPKAPYMVQAIGKAGYHYEYDLTNAKLLVRQGVAAGSPLAELGAGAYPGGVTGDTIRIRALFPKFG